MKKIAILGSTGSIGQSTLDVVKSFPGRFRVVGLSTNSNIAILHKQIKQFSIGSSCVRNKDSALSLKKRLKNKVKIFQGETGLLQLIRKSNADIIVLAIGGTEAFFPLLAAVEKGMDVALANKEALVMAGPVLMKKVAKNKVKLLPIDSEQSAIWQCLNGQDPDRLKVIYLTASGGPLRGAPEKKLKNISINRVLNHPRWKMGKKITVDSATLMNKGLEVLEAMYLFNVAPEKIKVLIHPEAIIHSMVEFVDGVIMAQLSVTDMRIPIQYALSYPERLINRLPGIDFFKLKKLNFEEPDYKKFPCLKLAYLAAYEGGTLPTVLNAANEVAVDEFLKKRIKFGSIPEIIKRVMHRHKNKARPYLEDILDADIWARIEAAREAERLG
ncbi:MAG: 1-deoxy-D-xylulose-5-phosphate reductoisomerase [Candidatus Omnitrophota bacterium]|nr:MAG: 1-deoxy-D-xylulose-5-phosphate reductoisomerase [Candidatus Omnitrophota bacterium]